MMLFLLKKNLSLTPLPSIIPKNASLFFFSSSASAAQNPPPKSNFIADYLISSCGFSPKQAAAASKPIAHLNSNENADSVRHFLKHHGFADSQIRTIISRNSRILCADVDNTLKPNFEALRGVGYFSDPELQRLIVWEPRILILSRSIPRLEFWKNFLSGDTKKLLLVFIRNQGLICQDIDMGLAPKFALLKDYCLSETDIRMVLLRGPGVFRRSIPSMEVLLKRVRELGFRPGSSMFARSLVSLGSIGFDKFKSKMEIFESFGWSEKDFLDVLRKDPFIVRFSVENIREKMEFLVRRAGCEQSYIASHPLLLQFSLEKRLIPRFHIMNILKSSKLVGREMSLYCIMTFTEKRFFDEIILPNMGKMPKLHDTYVAACAGQILV